MAINNIKAPSCSAVTSFRMFEAAFDWSPIYKEGIRFRELGDKDIGLKKNAATHSTRNRAPDMYLGFNSGKISPMHNSEQVWFDAY